jgi:uncharacterized small protein (DUF1192 family)|tara:strand:- start:208 stop:393 length:186 start_codon:yes stop_codon:yes gene_type:complete
MSDFFEIDEKNKTIKILKLDEFSVEDLNKYIEELKKEINRVKLELQKKENLKIDAEKFFNN